MTSTLIGLKLRSVEIVAAGVVGNTCLLLISLIALFVSTSQIIVIFVWKPLRVMQQTLVVNAALADALKSISCVIIGMERLYLASIGGDEVTNQLDCMSWLFCFTFGTFHGLCSVLALGIERVAVLVIPIWYSNHKGLFGWALTGITLLISSIGAGALYVGVSPDTLLPNCNLASACTPQYYQFLVIFQDMTTFAIIFVTCAVAVLLIRRWRVAVRSHLNMSQFKKKIQYNAIKSVSSVVVLCLLSFFSGAIVLILIQQLDPEQKAFYGPFWGCFQLLRGAFDFPIWLIFNEKYRTGFVEVFVKRTCLKKNNQVTATGIEMRTTAARRNCNLPIVNG